MKTFIIEEEYTALRTYEVEANSKKEAEKIYSEETPTQDYEFDSKVVSITNAEKVKEEYFGKKGASHDLTK